MYLGVLIGCISGYATKHGPMKQAKMMRHEEWRKANPEQKQRIGQVSQKVRHMHLEMMENEPQLTHQDRKERIKRSIEMMKAETPDQATAMHETLGEILKVNEHMN